jgi:hypothetical protein
MSKIGFPSNPNDGRLYTWRNRRKFNFDSTRGGWTASGGTFESGAPALNANTSIEDFNDSNNLAARLKGQAQVYNTYADLPVQNNGIGFAFVLETNKLYYWDQPGVIADFTVSGPGQAYRYSFDGGTTYNYGYSIVSQARYMRDQSYSGNTIPSDIEEIQGDGSFITDDPTTTQYIAWTAPASTTYTVYSYQADGGQGNSGRGGDRYKHGWQITVPTGGKLYVSGGATAQKFWEAYGDPTNPNVNGYHNNSSPGQQGGASQILLYDPSVSTGTTMADGNKANVILDIAGCSGGSGSSDGPVRTAISAAGAISVNTTVGNENITQQGVNSQPVGYAHIAEYGGYPHTNNTTNRYISSYVTPLIDFDGADAGTNYQMVGGGGGKNGGAAGKFEFSGGIVAD